jgi:peptidoglycan/LPS O-acetylase OafA/YrhL
VDLFTLSGLLPAFLVLVIALACAQFFVKNLASTQSHEFASIDGLRGLLALGVFLHHIVYFYSYATNGTWNFYSSDLYVNFGQASVSMFFMLTGFLFSLKLIDGRAREIDWLKLYCSRFMRLTPLYLCLVLGVVTVVAIDTRFRFNEDALTLLRELCSWLLFTIPGHPDINLRPDTHLITAGVIWTLPYEWYFYLILPCLGLLIGTKNKAGSGPWLTMSMLCVLGFGAWQLNIMMFTAFAGGGAAAAIVRNERLRDALRGPASNLAALACLVVGFTCFEHGSLAGLMAFATALTLLACGADLYGLLSMRPIRALSAVSYGVYLLQGFVMHIMLMYMLPQEWRLSMTIHQYWGVVFIATAILVGVSALSWQLIESPAIAAAPKLAVWLRRNKSTRAERPKVRHYRKFSERVASERRHQLPMPGVRRPRMRHPQQSSESPNANNKNTRS